jgi:large subunit ribosomal protein L9
MAHVKLILREEVPKLGHAGDVVSVKPGYARNYLIPQGLATHASEGRLAQVEHDKRQIAERVEREKKLQESLRDRIQSLTLEVEAQAGEGGKLFGSVTAMQIAELLAEKGVEVDRRRVALSGPIKEVGEHTVPIRLHRDVEAEVKVVVRAAGEPADEAKPEAGAESPAEPTAEAASSDEPAAAE